MDPPDPKYVKTEDGVYIAYQVVGDGPVDIAWQLDFGGSLDVWWDAANSWGAWFEELASFGRLILHDWRGTGLSSRNVAVANMETRAADLLAVLDTVGSTSTLLGAWGEGFAPCALLAASQPARVRALVWWDPQPRTVWAPDYPWGAGPADVARQRESLQHWGTERYSLDWADEVEANAGIRPPDEVIRWITKKSRSTCTPDVAVELTEIWWQTDVRAVLPVIQVPTLLIGDTGNNLEVFEHVASLMPEAKVEVLHDFGWPSDRAEVRRGMRPFREAVQRFVGIEPPRPGIDTVLSTVLFTDIVGSTEHQSRLGDNGWKDLVERHHSIVRNALETWRGIENDTAGDGFFATFDGPARAIHCAHQIRNGVRDLGIEVRAGVHTGECELIDRKVGGIAVSIGARISALAAPSQVLVSQTVKDLVAGSGFTFDAAGEHELKGVPDSWRLYSAG